MCVSDHRENGFTFDYNKEQDCAQLGYNIKFSAGSHLRRLGFILIISRHWFPW